jgi:hypothetical protein
LGGIPGESAVEKKAEGIEKLEEKKISITLLGSGCWGNEVTLLLLDPTYGAHVSVGADVKT